METIYIVTLLHYVLMSLLALRWTKIVVEEENTSSEKTLKSKNYMNNSFNNNKMFDEEIATSGLFVNTDDFRTLRLHGTVFMDKSEMITEYLERGGVVLTVTRPRKWGKSINLSMFKRFWEIEVDESGRPLSDEQKVNRILFTGGNVKLHCGTVRKLESLKISRYPSAMVYLGANPVVLLSLKSVDGRTYAEFKRAIANEIMRLYSTFPYLSQYINKTDLHSEIDLQKFDKNILKGVKLGDSLMALCKLLFQHFKRNAYILIDDYDVPIANAYMQFGAASEEFEKVRRLTYRIIKRALKDNLFIERGILSGTYHFGWINEVMGFHNIRHSTIVDTTFSKFYGFTEPEMDDILARVPIAPSKDELTDWYNGYKFDDDTIFNQWSVLSCISNGGKFDKYWGNTLSYSRDLAESVYLLDNVQEYLHQLLQGRVITRKGVSKPIDLFKIEDDFDKVLLFRGYLNPIPTSGDFRSFTHPWNLTIPNREMREIIAGGVSKWVAKSLNITIEDCLIMLDSLASLQIGQFREYLQKYLLNSNLPKTGDQHQSHRLVSGLLSAMAGRFTVRSHRWPGQRSREYTLVAHPDVGDHAIVLRYEVGGSPKRLAAIAEAGYKKIASRDYRNTFKRHKHVQQLMKIYLVMSKRRVDLKYQVSAGKFLKL